MTAEAPKVTVALCTRDRAAMLRTCLLSIVAQRLMPRPPWEIVVVDDGSKDCTHQVVLEVAAGAEVPVRYFHEEGVGVAAARNRAVREARGYWIAFIDDDEVADPGWLRELLDAAEEGGFDCVGGQVVPSLPSELNESAGSTTRKFFAKDVWRPSVRSLLNYRGPGAGNALVRRQVFDAVGLFDVSFATAGEDQDFFRRARARGYHIGWSSRAVVRHHVPAERLAPSFVFGRARLWGRTASYLDRQHRGTALTLLLSGLRLGHAAVVTLPALGFAIVSRDRARTISLLSSLKFARAYACEAFGISLARRGVKL